MSLEENLVRDEDQERALSMCLDIDKRIVCVSGPAGTGKTTLQRRAVKALRDHGYRVALVSPTGKAARRQTQATGYEALTIHKFLEFPMPGDIDEKTGKALSPSVPRRHRGNPVDYDIVIADEYMMVGHLLNRYLIDALPPGAALRCFGDRNQLRPIEGDRNLVGKEPPFVDMIDRFPSVVLETVHRQAEDSAVLDAAHRILQGFMPRRHDDFTIDLSTQLPSKSIEIFEAQREQGYDYGSINCQIISPSKKHWTGTYAMNNLLQKTFNPNFVIGSDQLIELPRYRWEQDQPVTVTVGDKVIWTKNNYDLALLNGDQGVVTAVSEFGDITVAFDGRKEDESVVEIPPLIQTKNQHEDIIEYDPRRDLNLAWCITTHKAQGSEYDAVMYITSREAQFLLWRGNFYTAVTRARKRVNFIGTQQTLMYCVKRKNEMVYGKGKKKGARK